MAILVNGEEIQVAEPGEETVWEITGAAPEYRLTETDQADPAGRWRWRVEGDISYFERATTAEWAADEDWITFDKANETLILGKATTINSLITFDTGAVITAGSYQIGRDADGTNQLHLNVPTGASFELSINDVAELTLDASTLDIKSNTLAGNGGTAGIQIDSTGAVSMTSQPCMSAMVTATTTNVTGAGTSYTLVFGTERFDQNSDFDGTSTFTAPTTGKYLIVVTLRTSEESSMEDYILKVITSNKEYQDYHNPTGLEGGTNLIYTREAVFIAEMDASDTLTIELDVTGGAGDTMDVESMSRLMVALLN